MKKRLIILFAVLIIIFLTLWYVSNKAVSLLYKDMFVLLAGLGIVISLYMFNRIIIFGKKLRLALRHILENNFNTGISMKGKDEITFLADKFNAVIDRINEFDKLRENKVDTLNRFVAILNRNIQDGIMVLDLSSGRIKINKAAQEIFSISQDELSIDSVIKLEANAQFNKLYQDIINRRANTIAADAELYLPILRAKAAINLKMFAIKDKDEKLNSVLCVFTKAGKSWKLKERL